MKPIFGVTDTTPAPSTQARNKAGMSILDAVGCGPELATSLARRPDGTPFTPLQLGTALNKANAAAFNQTMTYLASPQPAGGHETLIKINHDAALDRALAAITDRLADSGSSLSPAQLLAETREAAREYKAAISVDKTSLRERFAKADAILHKYREGAAQSTGGSTTLLDLATRLFTGYVKVTEATAAFNEREVLARDIAATEAAEDVLAKLQQTCERWLAGLETTVVAARAATAEAEERVKRVRQDAQSMGRTADHVISLTRLVEALTDSNDTASCLPELIGYALAHGSDGIAEKSAEIASRLVVRKLSGKNVVGLIRLEAEQAKAAGMSVDPDRAPLVVGERLLALVRNARPSVRLTDDANDTEFVIQIYTGETPMFFNPNLIAARFRHPGDEFAFMHIQTDVAVDELTVMREGEKDFEAALEKREFFVIEDLAEQYAASRQHAATTRPQPAAPPLPAPAVLETVPAPQPSPNGSAHL